MRKTKLVYARDIDDPAAREKVESMFLNYTGLRSEAAAAARHAEIAKADAQIALAQCTRTLHSMFLCAGEHLTELCTESLWDVYRNGSGEVVFEAMVTTSDQRNMIRATTLQAGKAANPDDLKGLFGNEDQGPDHE